MQKCVLILAVAILALGTILLPAKQAAMASGTPLGVAVLVPMPGGESSAVRLPAKRCQTGGLTLCLFMAQPDTAVDLPRTASTLRYEHAHRRLTGRVVAVAHGPPKPASA